MSGALDLNGYVTWAGQYAHVAILSVRRLPIQGVTAVRVAGDAVAKLPAEVALHVNPDNRGLAARVTSIVYDDADRWRATLHIGDERPTA